MKTYKLELVGFDDAELRRNLYALAQDCQRAINRIWRLWLVHHTAAGSDRKIVAHLDADKAWRAGGKRGERPAWHVQCFDSDLARSVRSNLQAAFPTMHGRVLTLLQNVVSKNIKQCKSARGKLPGWCSILLDHQSVPSSTRPVPIEFDRSNASIVPGATPQDNCRLQVRLWRKEREGKRAVSEVIDFELRTTGRAGRRYAKPILRIAAGEWEFKGSSLYYDSSRKKWFVLIVCESPPAAKVVAAPGSYLIVRPGYRRPVQVRVNGRRRFLYGLSRGESVASVRRQLLTQRWSRQEGYRNAGSANKGHGRERAMSPLFKLSLRWKQFTKLWNHTLTASIVRLCVAEGIGRVVYVQPTGGGRYLSEAGKAPGRRDSTGWDFFQIGALLSYKCEQHGINFEKRKSHEAKAEKELAAS